MVGGWEGSVVEGWEDGVMGGWCGGWVKVGLGTG